jgi:hypothetical protein
LLEVILSDDKTERMPPKGPRIPADQVEILRRKWIDGGLHWEPGFTFGKEAYEPPLKPRAPELPPAVEGREHPVDRLVDAHFAKHQITRPGPIGDAPSSGGSRSISPACCPSPPRSMPSSPTLARTSAGSSSPRCSPATPTTPNTGCLLERSAAQRLPGHRLHRRRAHGGHRLALSGAGKTNPTILRPRTARPAGQASSGFIDGIQWRGSVNASQTREVQFSQSISQTFLGLNMKCASCHDSFVDRWKLDEAYGLAAIFAERPLEIARCDKPTGVMAKPAWIFPELGEVDPAAPNPNASNNSPD